MDWLRDFQQTFKQPVYDLLVQFWPGLLLVIVMVGWVWWLSDSGVGRAANGASGGSDWGTDGDHGGDGGDGGGD